MSDVILSDNLMDEFFKFYHHDESANIELLSKLFLSFKPFLISYKQLAQYFSEPALPILLTTKQPAWTLFAPTANDITSQELEEEMVGASTYKILLSHIDEVKPYHVINVNNAKMGLAYFQTFRSKTSRETAKNHISSFIKQSNHFEIIDAHFNPKRASELCKFLSDSKIDKSLELVIQTKEDNTTSVKHVLNENGLIHTKVKPIDTLRAHDRYFIFDHKIEIILTSGTEYLFSEDKDFTYIVTPKN